MKRVISILLVLVMLSTIFAICASAFSSGGYEYEIISGTTNARITSWSGTSGSVNIVATVSNGGTSYKVTEIGDYAFANKPNISSVIFKGTYLTTIGEGAFSTNRSCTSLTIPANVTTIKARAFHSWVSLSSLTFNNGSKLSTIGNWAFRNAQSLSKLKLPDKASGSITIGDGAFSYCDSISSVVFPKCVTEIGEEAFIGCINLATVTIRNKDAVIGDNAFDLTANSANARTLVVKGQEVSTAKTFANAEGFSFEELPADSGDDTVAVAPDAGSYNVRVTFSHNGSVGSFDAGLGAECNDSCGVIVRYKTNNGTGSTSNSNIVKFSGSGNPSASKTIAGFPDLVYLYFDENRVAGSRYAHLTKLEVKGTTQSTWTTLWSGDLQVGSIKNPYAISIDSSGVIRDDWFGTDKNCKSNSSSGGWTDKYPAPKAISALEDGVTEASVNKDGSTYRSPAFTFGDITDQYDEVMNQLPTLSVTDTSNQAVTGVSVDNTYRKLILTPEANRSSDYNVRVKQTAGNISNYQTVRIKTFDYNIIFSYTIGTKRQTVTQTVDYGGRPTNPGVRPVKYDSEGHQTFNSWSDEYTNTFTNGPRDVTIEAQYNAIESHDEYYSDAVSEAATCTDPEQIIQTCLVCGYDKIETGAPALGHTGDTQAHTIAPVDGKPGVVYFQCTSCNTCWGAVNNNGVFSKDTSNEQEAVDGQPNIESVAEHTSTENIMAPAPAFNRFSATSFNYDYSARGASLKIAGSPDVSLAGVANDASLLNSVKQGMRFTASMHLPEGVSLTDTGSGNRLTDFGYVWSQTGRIHADEDIDNLELGKTNVQQTSVVANNSDKEAFTGNNWSGVSAHDDNLSTGGKTLTFNLVVNIKARNWKKDYCARAYIKYIYNGVEYTVYDEGYSSKSVAYVAPLAANSLQETEKVRNYCQTKIVNNLQYIPD